jgi:hypothetical protein
MLSSSGDPAAPVDLSAFTMPTDAPSPHHLFEGRLELYEEADAQMVTHVADWWIALGQRDSNLPPFDVTFTQCGRHLIPAERGRIITDDPYWDLFVSPGITWSTPYDEGMSRAAVPFAMTFKVENCLQNGVMTFLYDEDSVSEVRYQVTQETCPWHVFDLWGQSAANYEPGPFEGAEEMGVAFLDEWERRYPVVPLEQLYVDYPDVREDTLSSGLTLEEQTARGLWVEGTLYLDDCPTRYGNSPFCETMALPTYSLAKTLYVSLAMAAMAQEYSEDPYTFEVEELLPGRSTAAPGNWSGITLEHLVDMSTGHYRYPTQYDDYMGDFFLDYSLAGRLEASFLFPYQEPPGERVVYLTPNYQIVAAALDVYLGEVGAPIQDSFDYAVERVYRPIGLEPDSFTTLRTWERGGANNGTAFGGYGMLLTPQGTARLGRFLMEGGQIAGEQVLEPSRLRDMMFENPADRGAPMDYGLWHYNNGMWGYPLDAWGCDGVVPFLFGVSGVTVALAPNGVVYFAYNDTYEQPVTTVLDVIDAIAPLCP